MYDIIMEYIYIHTASYYITAYMAYPASVRDSFKVATQGSQSHSSSTQKVPATSGPSPLTQV